MKRVQSQLRPEPSLPTVQAKIGKSIRQILLEKSCPELRILWAEQFGKPPPTIRMPKMLMAECLAYRIQELRHGGLSFAARGHLTEISNDVRIGRKPGFRSIATIVEGSKLTRYWARVRHDVLVGNGYFVYRGNQYLSLSEIAAQITGMNWDGNTFFKIG